MKSDLTDITMVLDRSGSMCSIASDTIGGVNQFIDDQKKLPGDATFTLWQFDDVHETIHSAVPIRDVPALTSFVPRGCTALLDAMGLAIKATGERLKNTPESERPTSE